MNLTPFYNLVTAALPNEDVFMHYMPPELTRGVLILTGAGGAVLDQYIQGYKKARLQVIVRETEFTSGYDLSKQIMAILSKSRLVENPAYILQINPLHDPMAFPRSPGGFIEFSVNYETVYVET